MDLKPNEIAFLDYLNGLPQANKLPDYWKYSYGIDSQKSANKFINLGLMEYKKNYKTGLMRLSIPELKNILRNNSLKLSGKKEDLSDRILENVDIDILENSLKEKEFYFITSKGEELLNKYEICVLNIKKHYDFTDTEISKSIQLPEHFSTFDRLWSIFNERNVSFSSKKKWSSYRLNLFYMGDLLFSENKYNEALNYYIAVFIIDLSGVTEDNYIQDIDSLFIAPGLIKIIKNLLSLCDYDYTHIEELIDNNMLCNGLPFKYYSNDTLKQILINYLKDIPYDYNKYQHNKPSKNSSKYTYYGFYEDKSFDYSKAFENADNSSSHFTNNQKSKTSYDPVTDFILIFLTCGLWLFWMLIRPKNK